MPNPQRNPGYVVSCKLPIELFREVNRICAVRGIARNQVMLEAARTVVQRYNTLPPDDPFFARLSPLRQVGPGTEDFTRLERRLARMESWIEQTASNAQQAGWQPGQSRNPVEEMSVAHRNVLARHSGSRSNLLVDRAPKR